LNSNDRPNEAAQTLLGEGRFSEAIPHLESLVKAESCEAQDAVNLACSYQQVGNHDAAIELFDQIIELETLSATDLAALRERLGYCLLAAGDPDRAQDEFEQALAVSEGSLRAHIGLGLRMLQSKRLIEAKSFFEKAADIDPDCADAYNNLGALAWSGAAFDVAVGHFKHALEIEPAHRDALPNLLTLLFTLESYEAAESLLLCYAAADPGNGDFQYQLAYCHMKLGREEEGRALLRKILDSCPGQEDAMALLAECETV
jgi:tetratricopeptide (TPR) repeat protein